MQRITFDMHPHQAAALARMATEGQMTTSDLIREAIGSYLGDPSASAAAIQRFRAAVEAAAGIAAYLPDGATYVRSMRSASG